MWKWMFALCLISNLAVSAADEYCVPCNKAVMEELFASGEWPLPVREAPFPRKLVAGTWDLGENRPSMIVEFSFEDESGRMFFNTYFVDKETSEIIGTGPGQLIKNELVSTILLGSSYISMKLKSFYPTTRRSYIRKNEERMVYLYLEDPELNQKANFRVYKIQ